MKSYSLSLDTFKIWRPPNPKNLVVTASASRTSGSSLISAGEYLPGIEEEEEVVLGLSACVNVVCSEKSLWGV